MAGTGGSRRHLTIAFCDLVSSSALVQRHDPEIVRDVLLAFNEACAAIIKRYDGRIARFMGDGLLVCFGHPVAHEDDARRATLAALEMTDAVAQLSERVTLEHGVPMALRVGIDSGVVVVAETAGGEWREPDDLVGPAVNVAARIQTEAEPSSVVISGSTHELVRGYFETRSLGFRTLRGISEPVELVRVLGPSTAQTRLEATARRTPLVARTGERETLSAAWRRVVAGAADSVVIEGEAGIGKSRLVEWLAEMAQPDAQRVTLQCSPHHQDSPLYPVVRLLERAAGVPGGDARDATKRWRRLRAFLDRAGPTPLSDLGLLCRLASVPPPADVPVTALNPDQQRERTFAALLDWTERLAGSAPVLIVVEDLHWADPSTVDLLNRAMARESAQRQLLVITTRPGHRERLAGDPPVLVVEPLTVADGREMLGQIDEAQQIPPELRDVVAERSGGVPLFIEELARMLVGSERARARAAIEDVVVPPTLHDLLTARIEQLPAEKPLAQVLATIGQAATPELIQLVQPMEDDELDTHLQNLVAAGILRMEMSSGRTTYAFRHALLRDATYQSLLHAQRRPLHSRIADVLLTRFPEIGERRPEVLAHHFEQARMLAAAADYWYRAGVLSAGRAAHTEAVSHYVRAVGLLGRLASTDEHLDLAMAAQLGLGMSHIAVRGYAAPEAQQAYALAVELAERRGGPKVNTLFGLWAYYVVRGDHRLALRLAERCVATATANGVEGEVQEAHAILGYQRFYMGELVEARRHLAEGARHSAEQTSPTFPHDIAAASLAALALSLWLLGSTADARSAMAESLARADALDFPLGPFTRAYAYTYAACFEQLASEPAASAARASRAVGIALEHGFPTWVLAGTLHLAIANGTTGSPAEALATLEPGMAAWRGAGAELFIPYFQGRTAELQRLCGDLGAALGTVEDALRGADARAERFYQPELLRLRGDLRAEMNPAAAGEAEADYRAAMALASTQQAIAFELRAALSLHRSLASHGRGDESAPLLAGVVDRFPAGADVPDLVAARSALELIRS